MRKIILTFLLFGFVVFYAGAQVVNDNTKTTAVNAVDQKKADKEKLDQKGAQQVNQNKQVNPVVNNPNAPVITFDKTVHDYGTIAQHADGTCEFKFTNEGKEPLILEKVKSG